MLKRRARLKTALNWDFLSWARDRFGAPFAIRHWRPGGSLVPMPTNLTEHNEHVFIRAGTKDQVVYDEIFRDRAYEVPLGDPKFIIDAGAHIGLASVFFALRYPRARIIAIEPEPANFAVLAKHAALYPAITPLCAGLWSKQALLRISDPTVDSWSFRVEESPDGFEAVTVDGVMRRFGVSRVDVLKVDIEGSEIQVMNHSATWIDKVKALVIETHDRFKPGYTECTDALEAAIKGLAWERSVSGENQILIRA